MGDSNWKEASSLTQSLPSSKAWRRNYYEPDSRELLAIEPNELRFPFETMKRISCCVQLTNRTDDNIAFKTESTLRSLPLQELKYITNNFSDQRILGRGSFGVVYKGILGNGKVIAVKKFAQSMPSSDQQFENEVNLLRKLEHTNIVRLLGFCYENQPSQKHHEGKFVIVWDIQCLLCLEYLPNESLDKYISDASSGLDWPTRYKIIKGISYGLQYLHEQSDPIVHLDLKPPNILLDENMIPKITDFGLSRLFDQGQTIHVKFTPGTWHRNYPDDIRTSSMEFIEL